MFKVLDNKVEYIEDDVVLGYVTYPFEKENIVNIDHTFVDSKLQGKGIASKLLDEAYNDIKACGYKARVTCTYAINWFNKHENCKDILC